MVWFYGEPGHGNSIIDVMSSFGCKGPLRQAILSEDQWFDKGAEQMVQFLTNYFKKKNNTSKVHYFIDSLALSKLRKKKRNSHPIKGCRNFI